MLLPIIGIVAAVILGAFAGRIASNLMNRDEITINPVVCLIIGIVGGGLGGWLGSVFEFADGIYMVLLQIGVGIVLAAFLLLLLFLLRERREDPIDDAEIQDEN